MTKRCSHCSNNGHNSRTYPNRGVKLFGVRLTDGSIRKSASMGNLSLFARSIGGSSPADGMETSSTAADGYTSEDLVQGLSISCREQKRVVDDNCSALMESTSFRDFGEHISEVGDGRHSL